MFSKTIILSLTFLLSAPIFIAAHTDACSSCCDEHACKNEETRCPYCKKYESDCTCDDDDADDEDTEDENA